MRIFIEDTFDSAHWLPNVPTSHKCGRMHGHSYEIRLEVEGEVGAKSGWIVDYAVVKSFWSGLRERLDHNTLNDLIENPTCENLALYVRDKLKPLLTGLARIEIRETEHCGVVLDVPFAADPFQSDPLMKRR